MHNAEVLIFDQKSVQTNNTPKDGLFRQKQPEWQHPVILVASETLRYRQRCESLRITEVFDS